MVVDRPFSCVTLNLEGAQALENLTEFIKGFYCISSPLYNKLILKARKSGMEEIAS